MIWEECLHAGSKQLREMRLHLRLPFGPFGLSERVSRIHAALARLIDCLLPHLKPEIGRFPES